MTLNSRIAELQRKHMSLSQAVEIAQKSPASDQFHVAELKEEKTSLEGRNFSFIRWIRSLMAAT